MSHGLGRILRPCFRRRSALRVQRFEEGYEVEFKAVNEGIRELRRAVPVSKWHVFRDQREPNKPASDASRFCAHLSHSPSQSQPGHCIAFMDALSSGLRSPPLSRSNAASPRPKFDGALLKTYMKMLLSTTLQSKAWAEVKDREKLKAITKELGERVKERMVEIQPRGLYVYFSPSNSRLTSISFRFLLPLNHT